MTRDNLLFTVIGVLLGFIVGFIFASNMSQKAALTNAPGMTAGQTLPADHPPISTTGDGQPDAQQMNTQVQSAISKARTNPKDFDAQITAAKLEYQVQRYDDTVEFLLKANQIKPDDYEVLAMLGEANMEGGHYDLAATWYKAALAKKPGDVSVLASLAFNYLQKGDAKEAGKAIAALEKADPNNQDLPQFRDKLATLK